VQKDQSTPRTESKISGYDASDFLWAKAENVAPTEAKIKLQMKHKMAGAHVILAKGEGFDVAGDWDLLDKKVLVTGTTRKASIDLATGEVSPIGAAQANGIVMAVQSDASFRAIVVPQTVEPGTALFSITIGGVVYRFTKSDGFTFESGKLSTFTITINRKYPSGEYELVLTDTQISDWKEDINTHEGEARQYYCVNCTEPGTLGRLIRLDNKNPNKIRNLKVSGRISDEDFYFMRDSMAILEAINLKESKVVDVWVTHKIIPGHLDENGNYTSFAEIGGGAFDNVIPDYAFQNKSSLFYFVFPERIEMIDDDSFAGTNLSGPLVLPNDLYYLGSGAFKSTNVTNIVFNHSLKIIGNAFSDPNSHNYEMGSFYNCKSLSGDLILPESLQYIGHAAFMDASFNGRLNLPENLKYIGSYAFNNNYFIGSLTIPQDIKKIYSNTFNSAGFDGTLSLNNVTDLNQQAFGGCGFKGELLVPEGVSQIPSSCFCWSQFTSVILPSTLKLIGEGAFYYCERLMEISPFPEGLVIINQDAFYGCKQLLKIEIPSTLQVIGRGAFGDCFYLTGIISRASEPPTVHSGAFDGVEKYNLTVEVPANSVKRYQADTQWCEFKQISAHYDFSVSRTLSRTLNAGKTQKYTLYAPANQAWSIESKPDWISVTPSSGVGKTEVAVTFEEMTPSEAGSFYLHVADGWGGYQSEEYAGRDGEIVFRLNDKDYRTAMTVEQFDYEYGDGDVITLQKATKGNGVNLVFLADCYDARDIASGSYLRDIEEAYGYYFSVEPYATYKDYFNVYAVLGESADSGIGTVNTIRDAKFGSQYSLEGISPDFAKCYEYAVKADPNILPEQTLVVMIENTDQYGGICYMWADGSAVACCPKSRDPYPYDFRGIVQHEAGGHGFGKLADEYIYHNAFIQSCSCACCSHYDAVVGAKSIGWYRNIELTGNMNQVGWSHLIFNPDYSDYVDVYEGGYYHSRGVYRSEATSCMNNNIPYFSAISRQAIVERIMDYAGEEFTLDKFYENDSDDFGPTTKAGILPELPVESVYSGKQHAPVFMGDKPEFKK
jgi:hypothetical protein